MANKYWMKFYHETIDDPKVARLPDNLWRRFFECCLLAGETNLGGRLPPIAEIAWRLRIDEAALSAELNQLVESGLLDHNVEHVLDEGYWMVVNFAKRQTPMSGAERMRKLREQEKKDNYYGIRHSNETPIKIRNGVCDEGVTNRHTDIDKDKDTDTDTESAAAVFSFFENNFMPLTPHLQDTLSDALDDYPSSWILDAMRIAVERNARNWKYSKAILDRWRSQGKDNGHLAPVDPNAGYDEVL